MNSSVAAAWRGFQSSSCALVSSDMRCILSGLQGLQKCGASYCAYRDGSETSTESGVSYCAYRPVVRAIVSTAATADVLQHSIGAAGRATSGPERSEGNSNFVPLKPLGEGVPVVDPVGPRTKRSRWPRSPDVMSPMRAEIYFRTTIIAVGTRRRDFGCPRGSMALNEHGCEYNGGAGFG